MRFGLVDRILELTRGERIVTVKAVTLSEEYLADHFPTFPVLPGVLMLEALVESAAWLVRDALEFTPSMILLRRAQNVAYRSFVKPGDLLTLEVSCRRMERDDSDFAGAGYCNQTEVVKARFGLMHFCLGERAASLRPVDQRITGEARALFSRLYRPGQGSPGDG